MAELTEEQKAQRARTRKRNQALAAEAEHRRTEARHREWKEMGLRLTRAELEAGVPCRGCGLPIIDDLEPFPALMHLTDAQRLEYDAAEKEYLERHGDCHAHRWSMGGSRTTHCGYCCPPPPLSERQIADISRIMSGWSKPDPGEQHSPPPPSKESPLGWWALRSNGGALSPFPGLPRHVGLRTRTPALRPLLMRRARAVSSGRRRSPDDAPLVVVLRWTIRGGPPGAQSQ